MITGQVDAFLDARIPLTIVTPAEDRILIEAVIDTGFNGFLTLPPGLTDRLNADFIAYGRVVLADGAERVVPIYEATMLWDGELVTVEADAADTEPLVGMAIMDGYKLEVMIQAAGSVSLTRI